jgi:hypothetical protein
LNEIFEHSVSEVKEKSFMEILRKWNYMCLCLSSKIDESGRIKKAFFGTMKGLEE